MVCVFVCFYCCSSVCDAANWTQASTPHLHFIAATPLWARPGHRHGKLEWRRATFQTDIWANHMAGFMQGDIWANHIAPFTKIFWPNPIATFLSRWYLVQSEPQSWWYLGNFSVEMSDKSNIGICATPRWVQASNCLIGNQAVALYLHFNRLHTPPDRGKGKGMTRFQNISTEKLCHNLCPPWFES